MVFKTKTAVAPILLANIIMFILQIVLGETFTKSLMLVTNEVLLRPWTLITSMFLHGGFAHLFFNMYVILIFGPLIESRIGKKRFLIMYFLSGIIAAVGYSLITPNSSALGASGAIMGLLGVTIMLMPHLQVLFFFVIPMSLRTAGIIFALVDILGVFNPASGVAHWAHLFGLATGLIFGWYLLKKKEKFKNSFGVLKKYSNEPVDMKIKNKKRIKKDDLVQDAQFTYSEQIKLNEDDINEYLKNGRF